MRQYQQDRDPREPIFEFKRRTLVHFAVDTDIVFMTTRLAGSATHFLPFNKGCDGGAGNPPDPTGRSYRTAYLWEEVLQRDSLLDLLARFIHLQIEEKRDDQGRKVKKETMIFPRYHQLAGGAHAGGRRPGARASATTTSIEHSAGSGKSNTIGWLTHRLASLHDDENQRVFDSVIVVTDRVVLDQQLQDTIYQFEHKRGVVQKIDESSRQLAEALENAVPIIITTLAEVPVRLAPAAQDGRGARGDRQRHAADAALRRDHRRGAQLAGRRDGDRPQGSAGRRRAFAKRPQKRAAEEGTKRMSRSSSAAWPSAAGRRT